MPKLILLKGLPGSGKSTWAKEQVKNSKGKIKRVNKDDLREMIDAGVWSKKMESHVLAIQWQLTESFLTTGHDVIVDNTNFHPKHLKEAKNIIEKLSKNFVTSKFELEVKFFDTPLEECIKRDAARPNPVGKNIIMQMYNQYLKPEPPKYNPDLPDCIICDLDGTLAIAPDGESWYNRDFTKDILVEPVYKMIQALIGVRYFTDEKGQELGEYYPHLILLSGRSEKYRDMTETWLNSLNPRLRCHVDGEIGLNLFMRKDWDNRADEIVKRELYEQHILGKYNVKFIVDDRPKVVRMWRSLGLFTFDVNQRNEEF